MSVDSRERIRTVSSVLQLVILLIGLGAVLVHLGARDRQVQINTENISGLQEIAADLVKSQVLAAANYTHQGQIISDLARRLERIETRQIP